MSTTQQNTELSSEQFNAVITELNKNSHLYTDLIKALAAKQFGKAVELTPGVLSEIRTDASVVLPTVASLKETFKEGSETTEFKMSSWLNKILLVIGVLSPVIEGTLAYVQEHPFREESFLITGLCAVLKTLVTINYARGRVAVKKSL
jgi:hypothetical protein